MQIPAEFIKMSHNQMILKQKIILTFSIFIKMRKKKTNFPLIQCTEFYLYVI